MRWVRKHPTLILWLVVLAILTSPSWGHDGGPWGPYYADVLEVYDGDTVWVRIPGFPGPYREIKIRLLGIDTPEMHGPGCERELAHEARAFVISRLVGVPVVRLSELRHGSFARRLVGRLEYYDDGWTDLGHELMLTGLAREYKPGNEVWCGGR